MIFEGLAKRIITTLNKNRTSYKLEPISKQDIDSNHDRIGNMIDKIHSDQKEFDKKSKSKPNSFKQHLKRR